MNTENIKLKLKSIFEGDNIEVKELSKMEPTVELRSIEDAIHDFDNGESQPDTITYVVRVPKKEITNLDTKPLSPPEFNIPKVKQEAIEFELNPDIQPEHLFTTLVNETFRQVETQSKDQDLIYHPDGKLNTTYLLENAEILYKSKEFSLARNIYSTLFQQGEKQGLALYWMGRCFESENRDDEAIAHFKQSLIYQPILETFKKLTNLLVKNKKYEEAIEILHRSLKESNISQDLKNSAYHQLGDLNILKTNYSSALENYRKAIQFIEKKNSSFLVIAEKIANISYHTKQFSEAITIWNEILLHHPNNPRCYFGIANNYLAIGEKEKALEYFLKSVQCDYSQTAALFHAVKLAYELRTFSKVEEVLTQFIKNQPLNIQVLYTLAGIQHQLGKFSESADNCKFILNIQPKHIGAIDLLNLNQQLGGAQ